jgi:DNA-binding transcriptional ArsR family regulator
MTRTTPGRVRHLRGPATRYGAAALHSEVERALHAPPGFRHKTLFSAACRVGELVGGGEIGESFAVSQLVELGLVLKPAERSEVERTVRAGVERGRGVCRSAPTTGSMIRNGGESRMRVLALLSRANRDVERWRGVTGTSDLRVLVAVSLLALHAGKVRVGASYREIVETSGVSLGTVARALGSLEGTYLRRTHVAGVHRRKDRSVFQLLVPHEWTEAFFGDTDEQAGGSPHRQNARCSNLSLDSERLRSGLRDPAHPLWRRRGSAWRIWCALAADRDTEGTGLGAAELAQSIGMSPRTVWRNLSYLREHGIVDSLEGVWCAHRDTEAVSAVAYLEPTRELVRERHRLEREGHRIWLAARAHAGRERRGIPVDDDERSTLLMHRMRLIVRFDQHRQARQVHALHCLEIAQRRSATPPQFGTD